MSAQGGSDSADPYKRRISLGLTLVGMYYVYILKSKLTGDLYKGSTDNLKRRIEQHQAGKVNTTRINGPWVLLYYEAFASRSDARREELFLKSGKGRERLKYLFRVKGGWAGR